MVKIVQLVGCVFVLLCNSLHGQTDPPASVSTTHSLSFGVNYFPALYVPPLNSDEFNQVHFGYHLGYYLALPNRMALRTSANGNYFRTKPSERNTSIALELGIERSLLSPDSKWIFNVGASGFISRIDIESQDGLHFFRTRAESVKAGPVLVFGKKIAPRLELLTELNVAFGPYRKYLSGVFYESRWEFWSYRALGVTVRYHIQKKESNEPQHIGRTLLYCPGSVGW